MMRENMRKIILVLVIGCFLASIPLVRAVDEESQVNLLDVPLKVSEALGIPLFASQILCSAILFIIVVLPVAFLSKKGWTPPLIVSFLVLGTSVAIGWLPYWFLLVVAMIVALMFAGTMRDWITGK